MNKIERTVHWMISRTMSSVFLTMAVAVALAYLSLGVYLASAWASYRTDGSGPLTEKELDVLESNLESKLTANDYGLVNHAIWSELFAESFYVYGLANRYDRNPTEASKAKLVKALENAYRDIDSIQKTNMDGVGPTRMRGGVIFQGHRLHVLALLAKYRGDAVSRKTLEEDARALAKFLEKSPRKTEESYPGWAWWVDNVDAYAALALSDEIFQRNEFSPLISDWVAEMESSLDRSGNLLAEAYGPFMAENQSRSSASSWMIPYFKKLDAGFAKRQMSAVDAGFSSSLMGMPVFSEVPKGEEFVNSITTGPVLFSASSAGTMLSLAAYHSMGMRDKADSMEKTVHAAFFYDREEGEIFFGASTLLDATFYWALSFRNE